MTFMDWRLLEPRSDGTEDRLVGPGGVLLLLLLTLLLRELERGRPGLTCFN